MADGSVKIWHIPSARLIKNLVPEKRSCIQAMILQPQGRLVTGAKNGHILFWDIKKLISSIKTMQRDLQRNTTIDQAQLIIDAYDAPHRLPLIAQQLMTLAMKMANVSEVILLKH